jgi:hypothetical protein
MISPCKDCPDRSVEPNCHTACPRYQAYNAERVAIREARRKDVENNLFGRPALQQRLRDKIKQKQKGRRRR